MGMDTKNSSILMQILVMATGITLSSLGGWFFYKAEEKAIIGEFRQDVNERAESLYREVAINLETLYSLAILFNGNTIPELKRFSIEAKRILNRHPDIQALEWIPRVIHSERASYESKLRQEFPEFEITERIEQGHMITAEIRDEYFPVYYVEPLTGNEAALGFDLSSDLTRLRALEKSRDTATPQATASITLVQERAKQKGFLAFLPVYTGTPATLDKRRQNLKGFILGVYRIGDISTNSALSDGLLGIEIELVDETVSSGHEILHSHRPSGALATHKNLAYRKELPEIWGRKWSMIATPTLNYIAARRDILPFVVFVSGVVFTLLIAVYIHIITRRANIVQRIVAEKTNELNEVNKQLKELSRLDGLTKISNRRFMDEFLDREWLRAIRNNLSISFILIDIDFFKLYNDNYGHLEGDECLKKVAAKLKSLVRRPGDLVARYGGEEFALILTDTEGAELVARNARRSIEELQIPHEFSEASNVVTISVGLCSVFPKRKTDPSWVIDSADQALYEAKKSGRNKVEKSLASDSQPERNHEKNRPPGRL